MTTTPAGLPITTSPEADATIMGRLKFETAELHAAAETHEFQKRLVQGALDQRDYVRWLGQMLLVHQALEARLRELCAQHAGAAALVREEQFQVPYLREDLAHFGAEACAVAPLPATTRLIGKIESLWRSNPVAILGHHYVLEGSNNGNRFIARALMKGLGLAPGAGLRYLDPYGEAQRAKWMQFREDMNAIGFNADERNAIVDAAKDMFRAIGEISTDLVSAPASAPARCGCPHAAMHRA